jgi:3-dehydroquinate synthetase
MARDKKAGANSLRLVLSRGIGRTFLQSGIDGDSLAGFLRRND